MQQCYASTAWRVPEFSVGSAIIGRRSSTDLNSAAAGASSDRSRLAVRVLSGREELLQIVQLLPSAFATFLQGFLRFFLRPFYTSLRSPKCPERFVPAVIREITLTKF